MNKILTLTITLGILLAGCTLNGTSRVSNQRQKSTTAIITTDVAFERKKECLRLCSVLYEDDKISAHNLGLTLVPQYAYSEKLNTCLYRGGSFSFKSTWRRENVTDCLSNKTIIYYSNLANGNAIGSEYEKFDVQANKLMADK